MSVNGRGGKNVQKLVGIGKSLHLLVFSKQVALDRLRLFSLLYMFCLQDKISGKDFWSI